MDAYDWIRMLMVILYENLPLFTISCRNNYVSIFLFLENSSMSLIKISLNFF